MNARLAARRLGLSGTSSKPYSADRFAPPQLPRHVLGGGGVGREEVALRSRYLMIPMLLATTTPCGAASPFVYKGNGGDGVKGLAAYTAGTGLLPGGAVDFLSFDSVKSMRSDAAWSIPAWKGKVAQLAESVPLATKDVSLAQAQTGALDESWTEAARLLVAAGFPDAYVRLGWEFNGGWYPWAFKGREQTFAAVFRRAALAMRGVPGARFRFVWNPSIYENQQWPDASWPGDDVVDVVALDVYNQSWAADSHSAPNVAAEPAMWNHVYNDSWGVADAIKFAAKHRKPYAFPEWGTGNRPDGHGGGDDPYFIRQMAPIIAKAEFSGVWDYPAGDYNALFSDGSKPEVLAEYRRAFGGSVKDMPRAAVAVRPSAARPIPQISARGSGAGLSAQASGGATVTVLPSPDGGAILKLHFPASSTMRHYTIWLSQTRRIEAWGRLKQLGWDTRGGKAVVRVQAE